MSCQQIAPDAAWPTVKGVLGITLIIGRPTEMEFTGHTFLRPIHDEQTHIRRLGKRSYIEWKQRQQEETQKRYLKKLLFHNLQLFLKKLVDDHYLFFKHQRHMVWPGKQRINLLKLSPNSKKTEKKAPIGQQP